MNVDDLMDVWRTQDAPPMVDKTLLHQALRHDQTAIERDRRWTFWLLFPMGALILAGAVGFLYMLLSPAAGEARIVWDYVVLAVAVSAGLVTVSTIYVNHRGQPARERGFGDSLRDQLVLRIAQLDDEATRGSRLTIIGGAAGGICGMAILFASRRINDLPYSEGSLLKGLMVVGFCFLVTWWEHWSGQRKILPRKRRLEALLKELDSE